MTVLIWDGRSFVADSTVWGNSATSQFAMNKIAVAKDSQGRIQALVGVMGDTARCRAMLAILNSTAGWAERDYLPEVGDIPQSGMASSLLVVDVFRDEVKTISDTGAVFLWGGSEVRVVEGHADAHLAGNALFEVGKTAPEIYSILSRLTNFVWKDPIHWEMTHENGEATFHLVTSPEGMTPQIEICYEGVG